MSTSSRTATPPTSRTSSATTKRLLHELQDLSTTPNDALLHLGPTSDTDLLRWEAVLRGPPPPSPYAGGLWLLAITVPPTYPTQPPKIVFRTPICHPNVHFKSGEICLTLLGGEHWTPAYTLSSSLSAVQQLLGDWTGVGVDSPLNVDVANLIREGDAVGAEGLVRFYTGEERWGGEGEGEWRSERWKGSGGKLGE